MVDPIQLKEGKVKQTFFMAKWSLKITQKNVKPTDAKFEPIDPSNSAIFNDWIESLMPHCLKDEEQSVAGTTWEKIKKDAMRDDY